MQANADGRQVRAAGAKGPSQEAEELPASPVTRARSASSEHWGYKTLFPDIFNETGSEGCNSRPNQEHPERARGAQGIEQSESIVLISLFFFPPGRINCNMKKSIALNPPSDPSSPAMQQGHLVPGMPAPHCRADPGCSTSNPSPGSGARRSSQRRPMCLGARPRLQACAQPSPVVTAIWGMSGLVSRCPQVSSLLLPCRQIGLTEEGRGMVSTA